MKKKQPKTEEIGIRELKSRASEVVRAMKEERARYVVTRRGKWGEWLTFFLTGIRDQSREVIGRIHVMQTLREAYDQRNHRQRPQPPVPGG